MNRASDLGPGRAAGYPGVIAYRISSAFSLLPQSSDELIRFVRH